MSLPRAWSLTAVNLGARGLNLLLFLLIGNLYGMSAETDHVFFLYAPVAVAITVLSGGVDAVLLPGMHRAAAAGCAAAYLRHVTRRALGGITLLLIGTTGAMALMLPDPPPAELWLLLPLPILAAASAILSGVLIAADRLHLAMLGPGYGGLVGALALLILPVSAGSLVTVLVIFETGKCLGLALHARTHWPCTAEHPPAAHVIATESARIARHTLNNALWQITGSLFVALTPFINILFARTLDTGAVTSVEYAARWYGLLPLLFAGPLLLHYVATSRAASLATYRRPEIDRLAWQLGGIAALLALALIATAPLWVEILYGSGNLTDRSREQLSGLLRCYLIGIAPTIAGLVYVRSLSALGRNRAIATITVVALAATLLGNALLIQWYGLNGIGLATSLTALLLLPLLRSAAK